MSDSFPMPQEPTDLIIRHVLAASPPTSAPRERTSANSRQPHGRLSLASAGCTARRRRTRCRDLQLIAGATACANVLTISAAELHDELATIYDGILVDDDLDTGVLTVSSASAHGMSVTAQSPTRTSPLS